MVDLTLVGGRWRLTDARHSGYNLHHSVEITKGKRAGERRWVLVGDSLSLVQALDRIVQEAPKDREVRNLAQLRDSVLAAKAEIAHFLTFAYSQASPHACQD